MDRPSKGLPVDHIDEENREEKATEEPQDEAKKPDHSCLDQYGLLNLPSEPTDRSKYPDVPLPLDHQGVERIDDPEEGHDDGDQLE